MGKAAVIKILARFHKEIEAREIRPLKVILYGSYASNSNREGSDIDIVVIFVFVLLSFHVSSVISSFSCNLQNRIIFEIMVKAQNK